MTSVLDRPALRLPDVVDDGTRREFIGGGVLAALLAGCGSTDSDEPSPDDASRSVRHKFGVTRVPATPKRIVTVGLVDHDAVLALGLVPVGITADAYSADQPHGVWVWARDRLRGKEPVVLPAPEISFERIAALRPDLILAVYSGLDRGEYDKLSRIAPTVAQSAAHGDYQTPWDEMTRAIGAAVGRERAADAAVAKVERLFAEARAEHPEFAGKTAVYAGIQGPGQYYAETEGSTRAAILTGLGFDIPDIPSDGFYAEVSQERLDLFDRDVVLWEAGSRARQRIVESDPVYSRLAVAKEGRDVFVVDEDLAGGLALISVLSLPFVIRELVPMLAAAFEGRPA
jgi:iron complex transport system substrate-binding protein